MMLAKKAEEKGSGVNAINITLKPLPTGRLQALAH